LLGHVTCNSKTPWQVHIAADSDNCAYRDARDPEEPIEFRMEEDHDDDQVVVDESAVRAGYGSVQGLPVQDDGDDDDACAVHLRQVRREAAALPCVVTAAYENGADEDDDEDDEDDDDEYGYNEEEGAAGADNDECDVDNVDNEAGGTAGDEDADRKPSMAWARTFLTRFASLRRNLRRVREGTGDPYGKCMMALSEPSMIGLGQVRLCKLLSEAADALEREGITRDGAMRIYEISALVDWPCHSDTLATMSRLVRACRRFLRRPAAARPSDAELALANVVLVICGGIFGQDRDFAGLVVFDEEEED